jgi:putative SOS response-associated peptidase YedK
MCGRFGRLEEHERVEHHFSVTWTEAAGSYNIAPQSMQPVVIQAQDHREVRQMRWGLVPYWAKDPNVGFSTFNARAEDILTKPAFRESILNRRCLVPADFFFEWQRVGRAKQPYAITTIDGLFAFAGIWDRWNQGDMILESFSIVTAEANEMVATIHNRMPVIIAPADYERWLTANPPPIDLLKPYPAQSMRVWPVSERVGNTHNDDAKLIAPQPSQSLFG